MYELGITFSLWISLWITFSVLLGLLPVSRPSNCNTQQLCYILVPSIYITKYMDELQQELEGIMYAWSRYMGKGGSVKGYPTQVSYMASSGSQSSDEFYDEVQHTLGITVDAIIQGLDDGQRMAINHCYLKCKWLYDINEYALSLETALESIRKQAITKGII